MDKLYFNVLQTNSMLPKWLGELYGPTNTVLTSATITAINNVWLAEKCSDSEGEHDSKEEWEDEDEDDGEGMSKGKDKNDEDEDIDDVSTGTDSWVVYLHIVFLSDSLQLLINSCLVDKRICRLETQ